MSTTASQIGTINDLPSLGDSDQIAIYLLETSFPYNVPKEAREFAGANFNEYGSLHAGIGIWDLTTGAKFSIEFVSTYYIRSLLPSLSNGYINWNNTGQIVVTNPINQDDWNDSRHISLTTGITYKDLIQYLKDKGEETFKTYQAVNVVYYPNGYIQNFSFINNDKNNEGNFVIQSKDSYDFVYHIINYLNAEIGCKMESYLQIYSSAGGYISAKPTSTIISWGKEQPANLEVYKWFTKLEICYQKYYTALKGFGAGHFIFSLSNCYTDSYAYVYASENSVYNITLYHAPVAANSSSSFVSTNAASLATLTPFLHRYTYILPTTSSVTSLPLGSLDVIILFMISCSILIGIVVCIIPFVWKKKTSIDEMNTMMMTSTDENNTSNKDYNTTNNYTTSIFVDTARISEKQFHAAVDQDYNYNDNRATTLGASMNSSSTDSSNNDSNHIINNYYPNNNNNNSSSSIATTPSTLHRNGNANVNNNSNSNINSNSQAPDVTKKSLLKLLRPLNEIAKVRETSPRVFDSDTANDGNRKNIMTNNNSNSFGGFSINDNDNDDLMTTTHENGLISMASPFSYMHSMTEHISSAFSPTPTQQNVNNTGNNANVGSNNSSSNSIATTQRRQSSSPLRMMTSSTTETNNSSFSDEIGLLNSNKRSGDL